MENNIKPEKQFPSTEWEHYNLWKKIYDLIEVLPKYFQSDIVIKGINVTDIFSVGNLFSAVIESQIVDILNKLRTNGMKTICIQTIPLLGSHKPFPI